MITKTRLSVKWSLIDKFFVMLRTLEAHSKDTLSSDFHHGDPRIDQREGKASQRNGSLREDRNSAFGHKRNMFLPKGCSVDSFKNIITLWALMLL